MAGKERKHSNSEGDALFREHVGEVAPVRSRARYQPPATKPARARYRRQDDREVLQESLRPAVSMDHPDPDDEMVYGRERLNRAVWRDLRRGRLPVQDEIDLHGCTRAEAKPLLQEFIGEAVGRRLRVVRVVHGKGMRSGPDGPVIKTAVNRWLRRWENVLAFCPAPRHDGGSGAVYVLLRKR